jgi:ribosome-associated protein
LAALAAEEKKASEIVILDVARKSGVTDYFLICSAESERQVISVKDQIEKALDEKGARLYGLEGLEAGVWVLMDYDDVVIHIFKRGVREHYGLDRLWADAKHLPLPKARTAVTAGRPKVRMQREQTARQRG